jgi:hypothetical protein
MTILPKDNKNTPSNNEKIKFQGRFTPGNAYGKGRPQGSRNKVTLAMEKLLDGEGEALARKTIEMALDGDTTALKLCMERLLPPRKDRPLQMEIPVMETIKDITKVMSYITEATMYGEITPSEAHTLADVIEIYRKSLETSEIEERITSLESGRMIIR